MDAEQKAFYEEHGYLVVKAALTPEHVQALNDGYDERVSEAESRTTEDGLTPARRAQLVGQCASPLCISRSGSSLRLTAPAARRYNFRESRQHLQSGVRLWSAAYEQLVDPPSLMPIVTELLNEDKWGHSSPGVPPPEHRGKVRLDHDNIHFRPGANPDGGGNLHTGYSGLDCREHAWISNRPGICRKPYSRRRRAADLGLRAQACGARTGRLRLHPGVASAGLPGAARARGLAQVLGNRRAARR